MPKSETNQNVVSIAEHLEKKSVKKALGDFAARVSAADAALKTSFLVTLFFTVILPVLPSLIAQAAPKIVASERFRSIARATRDALTGLLGE